MTKVTKNTLKNLQKYIVAKGKERGFGDETIENSLLKISEEVGELIKACRKHTSLPLDQAKMVKIEDGEVGEELVDLLINVFWTAGKLNIDMESEFYKKEAKNDKRVWKRSKPIV